MFVRENAHVCSEKDVGYDEVFTRRSHVHKQSVVQSITCEVSHKSTHTSNKREPTVRRAQFDQVPEPPCSSRQTSDFRLCVPTTQDSKDFFSISWIHGPATNTFHGQMQYLETLRDEPTAHSRLAPRDRPCSTVAGRSCRKITFHSFYTALPRPCETLVEVAPKCP